MTDAPTHPGEEVTHRRILAIAAPMTLAYMTTPLLGIVDTAVVGQLGEAALLGGLAAGAIVFDFILSTCNFLRSGTVGLVAQAHGRGDVGAERAVLFRALILAGAIGFLLIACLPLIRLGAIAFMDAAPAVDDAMGRYIDIRLLGTPFALANYAVLGYVLGRGEAGLGLLFQIVINGSNIGLSILLGLVLGYGLEGVALGTVAGEAIGLAFGLAIVARRMRRRPAKLEPLLDRVAFARMVAVNRDIMIRSLLLLTAFALFTRQSTQFDTVTLAANGVLLNLFMLAAYLLDGFATAAEQLAGSSLGAARRAAFDRAVRLTIVWSLASSAVIALAFYLFGDGLIDLMTTAPNVREAARAMLAFAALTPLTGALAFIMDGVFIGATWSSAMRDMMVASFIVFIVAIFALPAMIGIAGLWLALHLFLIARGVFLLAALPRHRRIAFAG